MQYTVYTTTSLTQRYPITVYLNTSLYNIFTITNFP